MGEDPRIPAIRRAFEEAHFDERTPDERGFAGVFEDELKPMLIESIGARLQVEDARRKRRGHEIILMLTALPAALAAIAVPLYLLFVLPSLPSTAEIPLVVEITLSAVALFILGWCVLVFRFFMFWGRAKEKDPNQRIVMGKVLERFGCRIGTMTLRHQAAAARSPIRPSWAWIDMRPETVEGRFEGRLPFTATRIRVWRKDNKTYIASFNGWYMYVDLPFTFSGTTVIRHRQAKVEYEDGSRFEELVLEDPEFRKRFIAQTDDQVEARVIFSPDVIHHVAASADRLDRGIGHVLIGFTGSRAHVWFPWDDTALSDWQPLHPPKLIEDLHEAFAEMTELQAFLRDIDVIAESEGFRAQTARNARA